MREADIPIHPNLGVNGAQQPCPGRSEAVDGLRLAILDICESDCLPFWLAAGQFCIETVPALPFVERDYTLGLYLVTGESKGDLLQIADVTATARKPAFELTPYPRVRGAVLIPCKSSVGTYRVESG